MARGEKFSVVKYTTDAGTVISLRASADAIAIPGNTAVSAAYDDARIRAVASSPGNKRKAGLHARGLVLGLPATAPATGYVSRTFQPIFTLTAFNAFVQGANLAYDGGQWEIVDKVGEA